MDPNRNASATSPFLDEGPFQIALRSGSGSFVDDALDTRLETPWFSWEIVSPQNDRLPAEPLSSQEDVSSPPWYEGEPPVEEIEDEWPEAHAEEPVADEAPFGSVLETTELAWEDEVTDDWEGGIEAREEFDAIEVEADTPKGMAIPRANVSDALGSAILDILWEPIAETDMTRMRDRLRRLDVVLGGLSDSAACDLLSRLQPRGDLHRDFHYRLSTPTRQRIQTSLRRRCQGAVRPPPPPPPPPPIRTDQNVRPPSPPDPPPDPRPLPSQQGRRWQLVGTTELTSGRDHRIKEFKYWGLFVRWEVELTGSANATDKEKAIIKAKWTDGEYTPELEVKFDSLFLPDVKIERDRGKFVVQFKKDVPVAGGKVVISPHLRLSFWTPIEVEVTVLPFPLTLTLRGQKIRLDVQPKIVIFVRLDWKKVAVESVRKRVKSFLEELRDSLIRFFGEKMIGSRLKFIVAVMVGAVLARLLIDSDDDEPIEVDPIDLDQRLRALGLTAPDPAAQKQLLSAATNHRRAFAKGFGDGITALMQPDWQARLNDLTIRVAFAFVRLPDRNVVGDWIGWSLSAGDQDREKIDLSKDEFIVRFRRAETALMFAVAAYTRGKLIREDLNNAYQTALQQASVAGMSSAIQHVQSMKAQNTYEFLDEARKIQRRNGVDTWNTIAEIARNSGLTKTEIQRRLAKLGIEQLPSVA